MTNFEQDPQVMPQPPQEEYIRPNPHELVVLSDLSPETIADIGQRVLNMSMDPGDHGAFVVSANNLVESGQHTIDEVSDAVNAMLQPQASSVDGFVRPNGGYVVDTHRGTENPYPHLDADAFGDTRANTVTANLALAGETVVTTAIEKPTVKTGVGTLPGVRKSLQLETEVGIPTSHLSDEVHPESIARSTLKTGEVIIFNNGGTSPETGDIVPGTVHAFDTTEGGSRHNKPTNVSIDPKRVDPIPFSSNEDTL